MAENSNIEWTTHTFNPWRGCTKVSPGCEHCYAETLSKRNPAVLGQWGPGKPRVLASEDMWKQPLKWNLQAAFALENWETAVDARQGYSGEKPTRPRVFCASLADWLDDEVPIEWLARCMELIMRTPNLDWLLLTKRPQNWQNRITEALYHIESIPGDWPSRAPETKTGDMLNEWLGGNAPANIWLGTTVEDQARADERIPLLLSIPAKVRFLSCEPLLGPEDLRLNDELPAADGCHEDARHGLHWVICGGESGPQARPMHPDWARSLRDQCAAAEVPFFFKQWGEWSPFPVKGATKFASYDMFNEPPGWHYGPFELGDVGLWRVGKAKAGRLLDGIEHNGFPKLERRAA